MPTIFEALEDIPIGTEAQVRDICNRVAKMTASKPDSVRKELQKFTPGYKIYTGPMLYETIDKARLRRSSDPRMAGMADAGDETPEVVTGASKQGDDEGAGDAVVAAVPVRPVEDAVQWQMPAISGETSEGQRDWLEAQRVGLLGEELVDSHFAGQKAEGMILDFRWMSKRDPSAPADFWRAPNTGTDEWAEVKATSASFKQPFFISRAELELATKEKPYRIYRVYEVNDAGGKLRVSTDFRPVAQAILTAVAARIAPGVIVSSLRIDPQEASIDFGPEIRVIYTGVQRGNRDE
jgi:hypothetical protein